MIPFLFIAAALWMLALAGWWLVTSARNGADVERVKERLLGPPRPRKPPKTPVLIKEKQQPKGKLLPGLINRLRLRERAVLAIEQAGLKWNLDRMAQISVALFLAGVAIAWRAAPAMRFAGVVAGAAAGSLPLVVLLRRRRRRLRAFEEQFPEALEFMARSMRAGHAFSASLEMVHHEFRDPLAAEFHRAAEEHNLGMPLETVLGKLALRVPLLDVRFFTSAVVLQKRTGGNLAELLEKLAGLIRERFKLRGRIRAVAAHGRITGAALSLIPVAVAAMMFLANREYLRFFTDDTTGQMLIAGAALLQLAGYGIIRKIVKIEV